MRLVTKTLSVRVKDNKAKVLSKMAFDCNQVWNAANALSAEYGWVPIPGVALRMTEMLMRLRTFSSADMRCSQEESQSLS